MRAAMKSAVRALWGGLPSQFWLLWTGILVNRIGGFVLPLLALYLSRRGLAPEQVGFTVALFGVGNVAGSQIGGVLADRIGRRRMLLLGLCTGALSMVALGFAERPVAVALCTFALGLFGESHRPAMQAMVADLVSPADRARAYGLIYWALNFGFAVAVMLAGLLVKVSYWLLFVGDATCTLAYAAVVLVALKETRPLAIAERASIRSTLAPLHDHAFLAFWILTLATGGTFLQTFVSLPLAMKGDGLSPATFGRVLAINGILIVLVQPWAAPLLARLRRSVVMACGMALIGIGLGATALARGPGEYSLTVVVWSLGEIAVLPTSAAVIADLAPANLRGTYQGAYNLAWALAWVVGPILGTQVFARLGRGLWGVCFGLSFLVAVGHLAIADARRRRLALVTD
jgi:MFS family permease